VKIALLTTYHNNYNYGGLLQAYATTYLLNQIDDMTAEQIRFPMGYSDPINYSKIYRLKKALNPKLLYKFISSRIISKIITLQTRPLLSNFSVRNTAFSAFEELIPHSSREYTHGNIAECTDKYDLFITGSDQVWNYDWYNPIFFLNFTDVPKISYAASIGHSSIPDEWKERYREYLKDFKAISVREEDAVAILEPLAPVPVEWVLDPTLLLSSDEWDEICAPRKVEGPYMFCYFLGGSKRDRRVANEVAKKKGLKIVTLPHLLGKYRSVDRSFGDIQLWDVGPKEFISLIKHADFVLTDSFHGSVFSNIYHRPFAAFEREGAKGMGGRLKSLTDLTDTQDRFLTTAEMANADYICSLPDTLPEETGKMRVMREKSIDFLKRNIEEVRRNKESTNA